MLKNNKLLNNLVRHIDINKQKKIISNISRYDEEEYYTYREQIQNESKMIIICDKCHGIGWKIDNSKPTDINFNYKLCEKCKGTGIL